ncbi:damage-control phosphatase ARMT1 family protein [Asanoa sp. WMMD1127]|uniref:damage-control phosphatase ARMT1 family protein n=1 Tax=Asanoa sp. WMMD1127 TaxID=3016107 RepID=UPI0024175D51|nr:damage-control phosphatase ARMT1 family protein [Asanoa sp. WMMD1127]MDG4824089.1 damage-control phosphatase ARMT1 family protein [Asanoa sp. WMMD1127]
MTPPELLVGTDGRYAREVFHQRHPTLVDRVADAHPYTAAQRAALRALLDESLGGVIGRLPADAPDRADWDAWDRGHFDRPWADAPFLWAESYFYRRILDAVDYFRPGPWQGVDPFRPMKDAELADPDLERDFAWAADLPAAPTEAGLATVVRAAVFGNRADISFRMQEPASAADPAAPDELLADDTGALRAALRTPGPVCLVADNAGREVMADLVLAGWLLDTGLADRVTLHVKPLPYYVSDATASDVDAAAARLGRPMDKRIAVRTHPFWCAPLDFRALPPDLTADLRAHRVVLVKGDLNYRRLVGDRDWEPTTPFPAAATDLGVPVVALRTCKSEVVVGLHRATVARLDAAEPRWRVSGRHGLVQAR